MSSFFQVLLSDPAWIGTGLRVVHIFGLVLGVAAGLGAFWNAGSWLAVLWLAGFAETWLAMLLLEFTLAF
jgi:predicted phage tail protein